MMLKRWIRELKKSNDPERVLRLEKYWTEAVFPCYLELVGDAVYENPKEGLVWARVSLSLAALIDAPGRRRRLAQSYAALGSAERATGDLDAAEESLRLASRHADQLNDQEQANIWRRLAALRWVQGRREEAHELIERAVTVYRTAGDRQCLCHALQKRGIQSFLMGQRDALGDLTEALELAEPRARTARAAVHNLATALALGVHTPDALGDALRHIRQQRRISRLRSVPGVKLLWLEGLLLAKMWGTRRAEVVLAKARDRLAKLGAAHSAVLVGLDLAALGLEDSHTLAAETMALAERLGLEGEALAALKLWVDAVQGGQAEHEALTAARRTLDVHARRQAE